MGLGGKVDGCAILYKRALFEVVETKDVEYNQAVLQLSHLKQRTAQGHPLPPKVRGAACGVMGGHTTRREARGAGGTGRRRRGVLGLVRPAPVLTPARPHTRASDPSCRRS